MPDTGASGISTKGFLQFEALQQIDFTVQLDATTAGQHKIRFEKGDTVSKRVTQVNTLVSTIVFYIVFANTLFLYCI
jgi:hypothetical protein